MDLPSELSGFAPEENEGEDDNEEEDEVEDEGEHAKEHKDGEERANAAV